MKRISTIALTVLLTAAIAPSAISQEMKSPEVQAFEFRHALFETIGWKMGKMVGAKMQKNKAAFQKEAGDMSFLAGLITEGFELKNNIPEGSAAKSAIWKDWETFEGKAKDFQAETKALAASGDMDSFDPRDFGRKTCGGCHKDFKERN